MRKRNRIVTLLVLLSGIAIGVLLTVPYRNSAVDSAPISETQALVDAVSPTPALAQTAVLPESSSIADVAAQVTPSVVSIFSEKEVPGMQHPFQNDPFLRRFFGEQPDRPQRQQGLGSGVIISADGIILTNNHVVANADTVRVAFSDGRDLKAKVIGTDPKSDLAVLQVKAKGLPALAIANSTDIRVGEIVLAIGNPFGLSQSVTMGIISAKGRANMGITDYEDFLQTDAAINPGNSGGALVNMRGQLVGVNTAIASRSGGSQGIGFAIPSNMAMFIKDSILKHGRVIRGWLGVMIQGVNDDLAESLGLKARSGVLVSDVMDGSPAQKAGLKRGDVVVAVDGKRTTEPSQLRNLIASKGAGARVKLKVLRGGKNKNVALTLGELPEEGGVAAVSEPDSRTEKGELLGLTVKELDGASRKRAKIPREVKGVLVTRVDRGGPAEEFGLRGGDVIVEVNRSKTPSLNSFKKAVGKKDKRLLLLVYRNGAHLYLAIRR